MIFFLLNWFVLFIRFISRFAFVQFETEAEAKAIHEKTNGKDFKGKPLNVEFAILRDNAKKDVKKINKEKETDE